MNKTKKLTQGAMMLAILGALILIDRITAYWFTELVVLIAPIIIIMYSAMQTTKDGLLLSIGIIIISFLLGNFQLTYLIYIPVGVITGIAYSIGMNKGLDKRTLMFIAILSYTVSEVIASYVIYPILGYPIAQVIEEFKLAMSQAGSISGFDYSAAFSNVGLSFDKIIVIIYLISTIIMGAMEGILIHILTIFLLKRFKIKDLGNMNLWDLKPNKVLSYICFLSLFSLFFRGMVNNETLSYILFFIAILGSVVLLYYGYIFIVLYGSLVLKKNIAFMFVILCLFIPVLLIALMIIGFLYGSGPLRTYLENKVHFINYE